MKILLIEDRVKRQKDFLEKNNINFNSYLDLLDNFTEEKANNLLENIINDSFDLLEYEIIICHKSVEYDDKNSVIISNLKKYCKFHNKTLVLFSGGISVNYYDNSEFEYLELNSKTFYSTNLKLFLEDVKSENENILMLCYGENWKLNIVSNILEKINIFISKQTEDDIELINFHNEVNIKKLSNLDFPFYEMNVENGWVYLSEIVKFKDSLKKYITDNKMLNSNNLDNNSVLIHNNNLVDITLFSNRIRFTTNEDIDKYISDYIIKELQTKKFNKIFVKDNLSSNYLELYGLKVAYHIRLSKELEDKRFVPIVIVSEFDSLTLHEFNKEANILFTDGIYFCQNTKEDIIKYQSLDLKGLSSFNYDEFLEQLIIEKPKDISSNHDISNEWSIYKWAELLKCESESIIKNRNKIEKMIYFKYLKALYTKENSENLEINKPTKKGKILLIDDEWNRGWKDIINTAISKEGIVFDTFEYDFKDKSNFNLYMRIQEKIKEFNPDVVILDLRLSQNDHVNDEIDNYTGIKILQKIHEINAGIQVIMLTATSKSTILEKLYEKKILGYIKKEHPEDKNIDTVENINKFMKLIDKGLKRKYLKEVFNIQKSIKDILSNDIFAQYNLDLNFYEPFWIKLEKESTNIFDILDNERENSFIYAMVSISSSLETILSIFINEQNMTFWDAEPYDCQHNALRCRISKLFEKLGSDEDFDMKKLIDKRNDYMHSRKLITVNSREIVSWFTKLFEMIEIIRNPPKIRKYELDYLISLKDKFNN